MNQGHIVYVFQKPISFLQSYFFKEEEKYKAGISFHCVKLFFLKSLESFLIQSILMVTQNRVQLTSAFYSFFFSRVLPPSFHASNDRNSKNSHHIIKPLSYTNMTKVIKNKILKIRFQYFFFYLLRQVVYTTKNKKVTVIKI